MRNTARILLTVLALAGLVAATGISVQRMAFERGQKQVEIVVDYNDVQKLAPIREGGLDQALAGFKQNGATSVGVYDDMLGALVDSGQVGIFRPEFAFSTASATVPAAGVPLNRGIVTRLNDSRIAPRVETYLKDFFSAEGCPDPRVCILPLTKKDMDELPVGFDVPKTDMAVALRPYNGFLETPESVSERFRQWDALPIKGTIIFSGNSALGHPNLTDRVVQEINARPGLSLGVVELVDQDGMDVLSHKVPRHVVQAHSITEKEMIVMKESAAVGRIARAVRERKIQVVYLRLFNRNNGLPRGQAMDMNTAYVRDVADAVRRAGKEPGIASPMGDFKVAWWRRALVVCGAAALVLLLACVTVGFSPSAGLALSVLTFPLYAAAVMAGKEVLVIKLAALATACLVPGLSASAFFLSPFSHYDGPGEKMPLGRNVLSWLAACMLTMAAGVMIASMLSSREFFLRLELFAGVKAALVVPFLVVLYCYIRTSGITIAEFFNSPVRYIEAAAGIVIIGGLAVYLMRSGNQVAATAAATPSPLELNARNWLEAVLVVRPRTKEFLFGHPAMLLLGMIPFFRKNLFYLAVLLAGVVGQAGLLNTFCHLHTPFGITVVRVALGILLGMITGVALRLVLLTGSKFFRSAG